MDTSKHTQNSPKPQTHFCYNQDYLKDEKCKFASYLDYMQKETSDKIAKPF